MIRSLLTSTRFTEGTGLAKLYSDFIQPKITCKEKFEIKKYPDIKENKGRTCILPNILLA